MPFFGGPGNNYTSHAIASVVGRLRRSGRLAYVAANGGLLSKHSLGIYGSAPPTRGFVRVDTSRQQAEISAAALPVAADASGSATVVGCTVVYGRDGGVASAPVVARRWTTAGAWPRRPKEPCSSTSPAGAWSAHACTFPARLRSIVSLARHQKAEVPNPLLERKDRIRIAV